MIQIMNSEIISFVITIVGNVWLQSPYAKITLDSFAKLFGFQCLHT